MSESIRIRTIPNGTEDSSFLKVKLEQDFDFIEILSLKISQEEAYRRFCSDYGVVVGRVIVNNGLGVPNAKVSIFIPLTDEDSEDTEISGLYPYKFIDDKDSEGVRYNLLPNEFNKRNECFTPVGTFPTKREVIDNDTVLEVYDKYYKFTTTTNDSGDFMLFGVPTGPQILNVDVDLSDVGIISQRPYDYIAQGENVKRFESPTKFKADKDLNKLMQVKSFKKGVNVQPFWGDDEQCDIGISRVDVDINKRIIPTAIFMGSLFADSEKNSINKNCRPRKDFGRLCETEAGEGTVEMIRKTLDGKIERFDVEGGRVINDSGTWAYQVPMNLDYMVTDEFGNLVPSDDPNKGVATRANVRFRIGKDITGAEGRLRTTAKYLVPHNPTNSQNIDYNFDENTGSDHFRDFHWNKIYTVANYIPRIQPTCIGNTCADNRNITGIKDVDNCSGLKTPFPFNRVDTDFNPLFLIICLILSIVIFIVWLINSTVISILNIVLRVINTILFGLCKLIWTFGKLICGLIGAITLGTFDKNKCEKNACLTDDPQAGCTCTNIISYIPCITLECDGTGNNVQQGNSGKMAWSPGCNCSDPTINQGGSVPSNPLTLGCWAATNNATNPKNIVHWSALSFLTNSCAQTNGHAGHNTIGAGIVDCFTIQLAEALNMFELDFYNDWINGTLYTYLLKYKKKKNGKEKFCDSDCNTPDSDNSCDKSFLVDTAKEDGTNRLSIKLVTKKSIDEGFIKQTIKRLSNGREVETLYYAPYASNSNHKLFATELIHLGSIFDCDWQGIPKLQQFLIPTTYKRPPYTSEYAANNTTKITCGMTSTGFNNGKDGLFFDIDCVGLTVGRINSKPRSNNLKRICEIGVNIDEAFLTSSNTLIPADCYIDDRDITQSGGTSFRDVFMQLNINDGPTKLNSWPITTGIPPNINTGFGTGVVNASGVDYRQFRDGNLPIGTGNGYDTNSPSTSNYTQTKNSYYFYFGTSPGRTALDSLNNKYFTECLIVETNDFIINAIITDTTSSTICDGQINTTVVGGDAPYTFVWTGPNNFSLTETIGDITGLCAGIYTVTVTDSNGGTSTTSFTVNSPSPLNCQITTINAINAGGNGDIVIDVLGGIPPYSYSINSAPPVGMSSAYVTVPSPIGTYIVTVSDSNGDTCTNPSTGVTISGPPVLSLGSGISWGHTTCGGANGTLTINSTNIGGIAPYNFLITGPSGFSSQLTNLGGLVGGTYIVTVSDSSPIPQTDTQTVTINPSVRPILSYISDLYCWSYPQVIATINAKLNVSAGGGFTITATPLDINNQPILASAVSQSYPVGAVLATFNGLEDKRYTFDLVDNNGCTASSSADLRPGNGQVPKLPLQGTVTQGFALGNSTKLTVSFAGGHGTNYSLIWYKNNVATTLTSQTLTRDKINDRGDYKALVSDSNGCTQFSNTITI